MRKRRVWLAVAAGLLILVVGLFIWNEIQGAREERWVAEAEAEVEAWLRSETVNDPRFAALGNFHQLTGKGYHSPTWNIQGYHYLTAERWAHFDDKIERVTIYVTQGSVTAPGRSTVGPVTLDDYESSGHFTFFVPHPELKN